MKEERSETVKRALEELTRGPVEKAKAREEVDAFFTSILPRLSALSRMGRLPDLAVDPAWIAAKKLWDTLSEGPESPAPVERIKEAMHKAVESYG